MFGLFLISDEAAKSIIFFGWNKIAFSFEWVPNFTVLCFSISSQYKYAFTIGESLAYKEHRLIIFALNSIDKIKIITKKYAMIFSHFNI